MRELSLRVAVGVLLGSLLVVGGFGATALAYDVNQSCHEQYDDQPDVHVDCDDALHQIMTYGGALAGTFGVALLGAAAWEYRAATEPSASGPST